MPGSQDMYGSDPQGVQVAEPAQAGEPAPDRSGLIIGVVVGCIVGGVLLLAGLLVVLLSFVWLSQVRDSAVRTEAVNNMRVLGLAVHSAADSYKRLPPALDSYGTNGGFGKTPQTLFVHLFPYIEQAPAYQSGRNNIYVPTYHTVLDPTDAGQSLGTSFVANRAIFDDSVTFIDGGRGGKTTGCSVGFGGAFPDGASNTLMFTTGAIDCSGIRVYNRLGTSFITNSQPQWGWDRTPANCIAREPQPFSNAGISVCMADGSTRVVPVSCSAKSWTAAMNPRDNMAPGPDF